MIRLILLTDFTEQYASQLLRGILKYSQQTSPWVICKMPPEFKRVKGIRSMAEWAQAWKADAVIGQFEADDDLSLFHRHGIVTIAQDYKQRFKNIPNITSDYDAAGRKAAEFYMNKGFRSFAFYGYHNVVWSDERLRGFRTALTEHGLGRQLSTYCAQELDEMWYYHSEPLTQWLLSLPKPTALFAADDNMAMKIVEQCHVLDIKIPQDLSVLGVDNDEITCQLTYPALSSMQMDVQRAGYDTAQMIEQMKRDPSYKGHDISVQLIGVMERNSTDFFAAKDPNVQKALNYIYFHLNSIKSVTDVIKQLPLSRRLFEIRFREEMHTTPLVYITQLRMNRFAQLLLSTNEPIESLCERMNLNVKNLSRQFKQYKGMTPFEYRTKYK